MNNKIMFIIGSIIFIVYVYFLITIIRKQHKIQRKENNTVYDTNDLALEDWIEDAKKMKEDGMSYREISDKLSKKGFTVSKSTLQRKIN
ncbi:MAG: hypothetical protein P8J67_04280, partial [Flavobacteriaceae bacterium]|nr:hypothetical protein [Flavobacteriaceae bacterium]